MSAIDGADVHDIDGQKGAPDRQQHEAGSLSELNSDGQGVGRTIPISGKLAGCGCFGCSSVAILAGFVALLVIVWGFLLPDWRVNNRYSPGSCVVLDKKLDSQTFDVAGGPGEPAKKQESYHPAIKIRFEAKGRNIETWAYDGSRIYSPDRAAQQAIADSFQVGSTYPCWYDPDRPDQAVLVRGHTWGAYVFLIVPIALWTVGSLGIWLARTIASSPPAPIDLAGVVPEAPRVPRVIQTLQRLVVLPKSFDPSQFGDPLATKVEWSPLRTDRGNFRTHKLVVVNFDRLAFRATVQGKFFALMFLLFGAVFTLAIVSGFSSGRIDLKTCVALMASLGFCAVGVGFLYSWTTPIVFDRQTGYFWKGRKAPDELSDLSSLKNVVSFKEIHALQLLASRGMRRYGNYEMNLVLTNGERLNVVAYGACGRRILRQDAATVAQFLGKPVWDAL